LFANVVFLFRKQIFAFRLLGGFLFYFFLLQFFYGFELYLPSRGWRPAPAGWNILTYSLSALQAKAFFFLMIIFAGSMAAGKFVKVAGSGLFYGLLAIAGVNNYVTEAHWPFIGWMLLASLVYEDNPRAFELMRLGAWLIFGAAFSASGISKIYGGNWWQSGQAIQILLTTPDTTSFIRASLRFVLIWKILTWMVLFFEVVALPLIIFRFSRPLVLFFFFIMHLCMLLGSGLIFRVGFSLGMLVFYFFLYEISWQYRGLRAPIKS
jgi:hypothetical protein